MIIRVFFFLCSKPHDLELAEVKATVDGTGPKKGAGDPSCELGHPVSGEASVLTRR